MGTAALTAPWLAAVDVGVGAAAYARAGSAESGTLRPRLMRSALVAGITAAPFVLRVAMAHLGK